MNAALQLAMVLGITFSCTGCSVFGGGHKVVKLHYDDPCAAAMASRGGTYVVAFKDEGSGELWPAVGTRQKLTKGTALALGWNEKGKLLAFAGDRVQELGKMPPEAQYVCWYRLSDTTLRARAYGDAIRDAATVTGKAALIGGMVVGEAYLNSLLDDEDCDDDDAIRWRRRH